MNPIGFLDYTGLVTVLKAVKSKIDGISVKLKLNGSEKEVSSTDVDIYAPTGSGDAGQILQSNGVGASPTWISKDLITGGSEGSVTYTGSTGVSVDNDNHVIKLDPVTKANASQSPVDTNTYSCAASASLFSTKANAVNELSHTVAKGTGITITGTKADGTNKTEFVITTDELAQVLPSYVDDAIEGYLSDDSLNFYSDEDKTTVVTDEGGNNANQQRGKIYIDLSTNISYRWTGSIYTKIVSGEGYILPVANTDTLGGILASKVSSSAVETNTFGGISDYQGVQVDNEGHAYVQVNGNLGYGAAVTGTAATEIPLSGIYNNYGVDLSKQTGTTFTFSGTLKDGIRYDVNIFNLAASTKTVTIPAAYSGATYCVFNGSLENIQDKGLSFDITGYTGISLSMTYYPLESGNVLFVTTNNALSTSAISSATANLD